MLPHDRAFQKTLSVIDTTAFKIFNRFYIRGYYDKPRTIQKVQGKILATLHRIDVSGLPLSGTQPPP